MTSKIKAYAKSIVALLIAVATWAVAYFPTDPNVKLYGGGGLAILTALGVAVTKNSAANDLAVLTAVESTGILPSKYDEILEKLVTVLEHLASKPKTVTVVPAPPVPPAEPPAPVAEAPESSPADTPAVEAPEPAPVAPAPADSTTTEVPEPSPVVPTAPAPTDGLPDDVPPPSVGTFETV